MKNSTVKRVLAGGASLFVGAGAVITAYGCLVPGVWTVPTGVGLIVTAAGVGALAVVGDEDA